MSALDIVIVGAGVSGLNAAYRVRSSFPDASFTIIEARSSLGGTWDLYRYPGVRSDSNLWTFAFAWRPWNRLTNIATGKEILNYVRESAQESQLANKIQYNHKLEAADWRSEDQAWTLTVSTPTSQKTIGARFVLLCTGWFNYDSPMPVSIRNVSSFGGPVLHPRNWPNDPDVYEGKRVIVVGSGATAVTMVPALAKKAAHVTMVQRSPNYFVTIPSRDPYAPILKRWLPKFLFDRFFRIKYLIVDTILLQFGRFFPERAAESLRAATIAQLPKGVPYDPHFAPRYPLGTQRAGFCPDGDFFKALGTGKASMATGEIDTVYAKGVRLKSGQRIEGDILVTATGEKMLMGGGAKLTVDGEPVNIGEKYLWNTIMLSDTPNLALVMDFANASWTLGADAGTTVITRVLKHMYANNIGSATARLPECKGGSEMWCCNLTSSYVVRSRDQLPKTLAKAPWQPRDTYVYNWWTARLGSIRTDMEYKQSNP